LRAADESRSGDRKTLRALRAGAISGTAAWASVTLPPRRPRRLHSRADQPKCSKTNALGDEYANEASSSAQREPTDAGSTRNRMKFGSDGPGCMARNRACTTVA